MVRILGTMYSEVRLCILIVIQIQIIHNCFCIQQSFFMKKVALSFLQECPSWLVSLRNCWIVMESMHIAICHINLNRFCLTLFIKRCPGGASIAFSRQL